MVHGILGLLYLFGGTWACDVILGWLLYKMDFDILSVFLLWDLAMTTYNRQTQMLICFLTNRKIENWQIYGQAYISMLWLFWWKPYPSAEKWHGCHSKNVKTLIVSFSMNVLKVQILIFRFGGINIITDGYSFNVFSLTVQVSAHGVIHKCHRPVTCNLSYFLMKLDSLIFTITWLIFRFRFKYVLFQSKLIYYYEI